jgi:branched-chain amino acid transport system substrate-binding protein
VHRRTVALALAGALLTAACSIQAPLEVTSAEDGRTLAGNGQSVGTLAPGETIPLDATGSPIVGGTGQTDTQTGGDQTATGGPRAGNPSASAPAGGNGGATDTGVTGTTVTIGSLFALSGPVSSISAPILHGVNAYFRDTNAKGGVFGRKIELKYYDDGYDPQRGAGLIRRLVEQDKVFVLSVVPSSSSLEAATDYIESKKIPVIGTSGLVETQFRAPMQFPVGASTVTSTHVGLKYVKDRFNPQNIALIYVDLLAGEYAKYATEQTAKRLNIDVCSEQRVPLSQPDYGPVWLNIRNDCGGSVDYVLLAIDPSSAIKAITAAKNQRFKPNKGWGGGAPLFLDLVVRGVGQYGIGLGATTSYLPPVGKYLENPAVQQYVQTVGKYAPSGVDIKNPYLEGGYVGAALTVDAIRRAGPNLTRAGVLEVLNSLENWTIGLSQPLTFKGGDKYANTNLLSAEIQEVNGELQYVIVSDFISDPWRGQDTELP